MSHTFEQKLLTCWLDWEELRATLELQSTGTGRVDESTVYSSAEYGSHLYKPQYERNKHAVESLIKLDLELTYKATREDI